MPIIGLKVQDAAPIRAEPVPLASRRPPASRPPTARILKVIGGKRRTTVRGTASDDDDAKRVEVASSRGLAVGAVRWCAPSAAAADRRGSYGSAGPPGGRGGLPKRLGRGHYRLVVRVTDSEGQVTHSQEGFVARRSGSARRPAG